MRDLSTEAWLDRLGVEWRYEPSIPLNKVNRAASLQNQARLGDPDPDHKMELVGAALLGELFAMIGFWRNNLVILIAGNYRMEAYDTIEKRDSDFYIVLNASPYILDLLTRTHNVFNSTKPIPTGERMVQALHLIYTHHMTVTDAAKHLLIPKSSLQTHYTAQQVRERLAKAGLSQSVISGLDQTVLVKMYRLKQYTPIAGLAQLIHDYHLEVKDVTEAAERLRKAPGTEKDQEVVLQQLKTDYADRKVISKIKHKPSQIGIVKRAITTLGGMIVSEISPQMDKSDLPKIKSSISNLEQIIDSLS